MSTAVLATRLSRLEALVAALTHAAPVPDAAVLMAQAGLAPDAWQAQVLTAAAPRTLLNCCRQSGKSSVAAVAAVHQALSQPGSLTLLLSPSLRQSQELFKKVQDCYRALGHPAPLQAESALRYELDNGSRIISLPGTEGTIRGYSGVSLLVIDEASRVDDSLYYAVRPMLAISHGRLVALTTPWGKRGFFYTEWTGGGDWQRVEVPATQCPRIPRAFLDEERRTMPCLWFESEYLCVFADTESQVFQTDAVQACLLPPGSVVPWVLREE